ncbi:phosphoserine phosphatase SerB [Georgenia sp. 10Sc9-8]|uniref:phosphoserine phosphatase n=1 Tax=Georgenia halotolerans TaxID=3028317 RepID=A0ABT5U0J6_9MICO|nr:phosphoserine phosphatase SerB [Georgenia halotolerans]
MDHPARLTLLCPEPVPAGVVDRAHQLLPDAGPPEHLHGPDVGGAPAWHAVRMAGTLPASGSSVSLTEVRRELHRAGVDVALARGPLATGPPGLLVMDVDSTLITAEVIELLAEHAGTAGRVAEVTERAMRGELDFAASLRDRVATLAGLPEHVADEVRERVRLTPGARELVAAVHAAGGRVGLVSGGFLEIVAPLAAELGIDHVQANTLEVEDGRLTGRTRGEVVDRSVKARRLREWAAADGVPLAATIAVGDGANDLEMLAAAGLGVAFCAKPVVQEQADATVSFPRLDAVGALAGLG